MLTNILIGMLVYMLVLTLFLAGWMRWQNRMSQMDTDMAEAFKNAPEWVEWHPGTVRSTKTGEVRRIESAGVRPYPE